MLPASEPSISAESLSPCQNVRDAVHNIIKTRHKRQTRTVFVIMKQIGAIFLVIPKIKN
jgi:hypothetical protein